MPNLQSDIITSGLSPTIQDLLGQCNALNSEDRAVFMAQMMNAHAPFTSTTTDDDASSRQLNPVALNQASKRLPSTTNGPTVSSDGSPVKVDNLNLSNASPVVDEEPSLSNDFTSQGRLTNNPLLDARSSVEIETDIVFNRVCGALIPTVLDEGGLPFLRHIRPALQKFAAGDFQYPTWMPADEAKMPADVREHFTALKIPRLRGSEEPCLLLHDLGSSSNQEVDTRAKMLSTFVDRVHHKCFVNCSGSGKTRLCLESLCLEYGLYFTCATPGVTTDVDAFDDLGGFARQIGSRDLVSVNDTLIKHKSFTPNLRHASVQDPKQAGKINSRIAGSYLVSVLVARLVIFLEYLGCLSKEQLHSMTAKRAWMYLQVQPFIDDNIPDVFASFASHVLPQHTDQLVNPVSVICKQIALILCPDNLLSLPIIIDESQVGAGALGDAFLSSAIRDGVTKLQTRPILREIVFSFATVNIATTDNFDDGVQLREAPQDYDPHLIITGSGLSREIVLTAISSFVGKTKVVDTVSATGAFTLQEKQQRYLKKYFPSAWLDHTDGEIMQYRAWIWLRGRFTASFIQFTLQHWQHAASHANVLLNMFVAGLSGTFEPWDALQYPMNLDAVFQPRGWDLLAQLRKLPSSFKVYIRNEICDYFLHSKEPAAINDATEEQIQSGIGLVHCIGTEIKIVISEPLICLAIFSFVNEPYANTTPEKPLEIQAPLYEYLVQHIRQTSSNANRFEDLLAYYFSLAFEEPRALNEVFNITCDGNPALGLYPAQLVTVTRIPASDGSVIQVEGAHQFASLHLTTSSNKERPRYAGPLGYRGVDDSTAPRNQWGTHLFQNHTLPSPAPILFPGHHMGPDLLFLLKLHSPITPSEISYLWVAVQAKLCHVRDHRRVPIATVRSAIRSVTPENFFMTKDGEWNAFYEPHSKTMKGLEDGLPGTPTNGTGRYHLLRVVCGYPAIVAPLKPADILDAGNHPIATLNIDQFKLITDAHPPTETLSFYQHEYLTTKARAISQKKENSRAAGLAGRKSKRNPSKLATTKASARRGTSASKAQPDAVPVKGSRPRATRNSTKTAVL